MTLHAYATTDTVTLHNGDRDNLARGWGDIQAAKDFGPLPAGEYVARIIGGGLSASKAKGTPSYKLTFQISEGEHQGRQFWHDVFLTPAALPMAKPPPWTFTPCEPPSALC